MCSFSENFLRCLKAETCDVAFPLTGVEWGLLFPSANGEYQSPINLNSREAQYDPSLLDAVLAPNYVVCRDCEVINDGHTVRILLKSKSGGCRRPVLRWKGGDTLLTVSRCAVQWWPGGRCPAVTSTSSTRSDSTGAKRTRGGQSTPSTSRLSLWR